MINTALCPVSDADNTTVCYNSLVNQGVIDIQNASSPSLVRACARACVCVRVCMCVRVRVHVCVHVCSGLCDTKSCF